MVFVWMKLVAWARSSSRVIIWWLLVNLNLPWASWHLLHRKSPHSLQYTVALLFSQLPHRVLVDSAALVKAWISTKWSMWKSDCSPSTPSSDRGTTCWQVGQARECSSLATSFSRHGDLQKMWKQGKSLGCLNVLKQIKHLSCTSCFFWVSCAVISSAIINSLLQFMTLVLSFTLVWPFCMAIHYKLWCWNWACVGTWNACVVFGMAYCKQAYAVTLKLGVCGDIKCLANSFVWV